MNLRTVAWLLAASLGLIAFCPADEPAAQDPLRPVKKPSELKFRRVTFTFARIQYSSVGVAPVRGGRDMRWATDYPDSDINLTARVAKDLGIRTDPKGIVLRLTDAELKNHPFIYLTEPGSLEFTADEVRCLREYLLEGGFLVVDDFWGEAQWANFHKQFERVFPDRPLKELPLEHPVFHCFYDLKTKPQVPSIHWWLGTGTTNERGSGPASYRGLFDDNGRMMAIICHNTDLGDGWEREGESAEYFREISQKLAYPLGVNLVVYALTDRSGDKPPEARPVKK